MENKDLVTIFDEYFGEEYNTEIFNNARKGLEKIQAIESLKLNNKHLRTFVNNFHLMKKNYRTATDYFRKGIKTSGFSLLKKFVYSIELNRAEKTNAKVFEFEDIFMSRTGISLVEVEDFVFYREKEQETSVS